MKKRIAHLERAIVTMAILLASAVAIVEAAAPQEGPALPGDGASALSYPAACPDQWEHNGTFFEAAVIQPGNTYATICPQYDWDYYKFWVVSGQQITLEMDDMPKPYDLVLYDINQARRIAQEGGGLSRYLTFSDPWTATGYWYALVHEEGHEWSETHYELSLTLGPAPRQPLLDLSKQLLEPASGISTVGGPVRFQITLHNAGPTTIATLPLVDNFDDVCLAYEGATPAPDNADLARHLLLWYNLGPLAPGASKTVTVNFAARAVCESALNRAGVTTAVDEHDMPVPERLADATVRIVAAPTPTATPPTCPTEHEPNDSFEEAAIITPGAEVLSYICPADDVDTFQFFAENGQEIRAHLYHMSYNADLELYDPSEVSKGLSDHLGTADEELEITADQTGQFYARVFGTEGGQVNPYHLLVTVSGEPVPTPTPVPTATPMYPACPDGFEPNNWCGPDKPAWDLTASGFWSYICAGSDVDFWRIRSVALGQTMEIVLDYEPYVGDHKAYELRLFNPQCSAVAGPANTNPQRIRYTANMAGTWYAQASCHSDLYSVRDPYHIWATVSDCAMDRLEKHDDRDDNDAWYNAVKLGHPTTTRVEDHLTLCPRGEADWFAVEPGAQDLLRASLTYDPGQAPLQMCVHSVDLDRPDPDIVLACTHPDLGINSIDYLSPDSSSRYLVVKATTPTGMNRNYSISVQVLPDLTVEGVEITQVTQRYPANDVPLVAGKTTVVRAYIKTTQDLATDQMRLRVVGGDPPGSRYIYPQHSIAAAKPGVNPRGDLSQSANFVLPAEYTTRGSLLVEAEVNYDRRVPETDYSNNTATRTVTFNDRQRLNVVFVRVRYQAGTTWKAPPPDAAAKASANTVKLFPVPSLNILVPTTKDTIDFTGSLSSEEEWNELLRKVEDMAAHSTGFSGLVKWYGLVPDLGKLWGIAGVGYAPGRTAVGECFGAIMAHEVSHNFGRLHAPCGSPKYLDQEYPETGGRIQEFGLDPATMELYDPAVTFDLMSYCSPQWLSPYTYEALFNAIGPGTAQAVGMANDEQDYLLQSLELDEETGQGQLGDAYVDSRPLGTNDSTGEGSYSIELQEAAGAVLFTRRFDPNVIELSNGSRAPATSWLEVLPFPAGTQLIVLRHQGRELDRRERNAHAPAVAVTSPNGGEALDGEFEVRWSGSDEDGDALVYTLQYSIDGGQTWTAAAVGLTTTSYMMDATHMAGSSAGKMRVLASDGLNTSADESDGSFSVPRKPPEAYILTPDEGAAFQPGDFIILRGVATDREDGPLAGQALSWSSDQHGTIGSGDEVLAPSFDPGWHEVTFTAEDSDGNVAEDTIRVWIGSRLYLPVCVK